MEDGYNEKMEVRRMKKRLSLLLAVSLVLGLLASCAPTTPGASGSSSPAPSGSAEPSNSSTPIGPKEVTVNLIQEPPELNSVLTTSTGSGDVLRHIMRGLVALDATDTPIPAIATKWDVSEDKKTYTFHLRDDAKWTNGDPVVADDFIYAWTMLFTAETAANYAGTWSSMILGADEHLNSKEPSAEVRKELDDLGYTGLPMGFKALDDATLQVSLTNPYPYFLQVLSFYNFLPMNQKGVEAIGFDQYAKEVDKLVTNGAYKMTSWTHEDNIVMEKDPTYYDAANIKIDKITMVMISDAGAALNAFQAGEIDMLKVNADNRDILKAQGVEIHTYDDGGSWYFEMNTTLPGLNNSKVRRALTLGVDAETFVAKVVNNNSTVANSFVPPAIDQGKFTEACGPQITRGDYAGAKALLEEGLAEEGLTPATFKPVLIADDTTAAQKYAAFFKEQFKNNLGVDLDVQVMTYKNRIARMQSYDFSIVFAGWGPDYNDPMTFLDLFLTGSGNNHTQYSNPEYDQLVADARKEPDAAKRQDIMIEIEKILAQDAPIGYVYNRATDYVLSDRLTGYVCTAFTDMSLLEADIVE
jgi:oligopeptide transport system substrate-binding protein